jgi:hypothetical protein
MKIDDKHADGMQVTGVLTIKLWSNGAMSVEGPIEDTTFCLAILENAKDAVRNHKSRRADIVIPGRDVSVEQPLHPLPGRGLA